MLCADFRILRSQLVVLVDPGSQSIVGRVLSNGARLFVLFVAPQLEGDRRGRGAPDAARGVVPAL
jgi:hypothetical protein